jgi:hypothetical protein
MATRTFHSLVQRLVTSVPGCPQPVIEQYVRDSAIDACERTLAWRYEQPLIRLTPGVYDYPYENPTQSEVHAFITASVNGRSLSPVTMEWLHRSYPDWPSTNPDHRADPRYIVHLDDDTFAVAPIPDDSQLYDLKMIVALKPLRTATGMDQTAMDDLENVIMHGALRDLLVLPNKNWSDRELASYHAKQYVFKTTERRARVMLGAGRASVSVQMQPFA